MVNGFDQLWLLIPMRMFILILALIFLWKEQLHAIPEEERLSRRIQAHLTIKDLDCAIEEAQQALLLYPQSAAIHEAYIRALAKSGKEKLLIEAWEIYVQQFPNKALNRELIEEMAWGILQKASFSPSIVMRQMALLAAFLSQEGKGIDILSQGMKDGNYAIRAIAVKLVSHFNNEKLTREIKRLFKEEKVWIVRRQVIEAIGKMKIASLKTDLEALIASEESLSEEKALAIASLIKLLETVNRTEIEYLSSSNRTGLRQLACQAIAYFQSSRDLDQLLRLAEDPQPQVRFEAFQAIGQLRPVQQVDKIVTLARQGIQDLNYQVALSASWLLTLYLPEEGQQGFIRLLNDRRSEVRALAAAALSATGSYGVTLTLDQYRLHADSYVRLNLALGLIKQRQAIVETANYLRNRLITDKDKWSTKEVGIFRAILSQPYNKKSETFETPESDNQLLRLELLNLLAILQVEDIQQSIRDYLIERSWEISTTAAALLLTEGDESAIELVQQLLKDRQPRVRLHAALILSLWSREESAIQILEEGYVKSEWEMKAKILEGLGRIGSVRSVPFLLEVLKEPSQTLRLIAAMALIQSLNH